MSNRGKILAKLGIKNLEEAKKPPIDNPELSKITSSTLQFSGSQPSTSATAMNAVGTNLILRTVSNIQYYSEIVGSNIEDFSADESSENAPSRSSKPKSSKSESSSDTDSPGLPIVEESDRPPIYMDTLACKKGEEKIMTTRQMETEPCKTVKELRKKLLYVTASGQSDVNTLHGTYQYLKTTGQIHSLIADTLNNTKKAEVDILFFNRVPKVGSQSLMELMKQLSEIHGYSSLRDKPKQLETILVTANKEFEVADEIMELKEPVAFSKHIAYINFTKLDYPKPIYINMVRDPVERLVSWFYYIRAPWYIADRKKHFPDIELPSVKWLKKEFESCLQANDPECVYEQDTKKFLGDHRRQMLFFCGQDDDFCLPFNSYHAMQRAKMTVEKDYAVVGSWEDTNVTLTVLEKYIPRFFKGASEIYYKGKNALSKVNKNSSRPPVTQGVRKLLNKNLTNEIEFYQFCKQRLYKQYIAAVLN